MTHDNLIEQSALAVAHAEKQVANQTLQLNAMRPCEYGSKSQQLTYEKLLDDQLELKKLQVRHLRITRPTVDAAL